MYFGEILKKYKNAVFTTQLPVQYVKKNKENYNKSKQNSKNEK